MKNILLLILLLVVSGNTYSGNKEMELLLVRLDSVLANSEKYIFRERKKR